MATIVDDSEDVVTEAQSKTQSVKLQSSDVLDCPICFEPLKKPIYQCTNGHLSCSSCCKKINNRCSFCTSPIGDIRCRAMEKVIEATIVPCPNAKYGCKESTTYGNKSSIHEKVCVFARCFCPLQNCNYVGSYTDLKGHANAAHSWEEYGLISFVFDRPLIFGMNINEKKMVVFREEEDGDLVVVQAFKGTEGVSVTVSCIAPLSPGIRNLSCSVAKLNECTTLRLRLRVKNIQKVSEQMQFEDGFMFIPSYMLSGGHMKMQICIGCDGYKYIHI
ncbi:PREDICTED: E3 ubiquitin-protein ligase SINA-like 5 isoform X1 [Camelina sativa]|uniref:RING-type E3 ubiquitin transferase n=1 Tax=Camelina sativa TaxID=90675 RepID=A0ABM0WFY1_CAMSA|nr:PREDICTED: E3 ubiquitin-protein ligase SINA-like 5 isoform X1 [Camelina sativa]